MVTLYKPLPQIHFLKRSRGYLCLIVKESLLRRSFWCHFLLMAGVKGSASYQDGICHLTDEQVSLFSPESRGVYVCAGGCGVCGLLAGQRWAESGLAPATTKLSGSSGSPEH